MIDLDFAFDDRNARTFRAAFDRENRAFDRDERIGRLNIQPTVMLFGGFDDDIAALRLTVTPRRFSLTENSERSRISTVEPSASRRTAFESFAVRTRSPF